MRQVQIKDVELSTIRLPSDPAKLLNCAETQDLARYFQTYTSGKRMPSLVLNGMYYDVITGDTNVAAFIIMGKKFVRSRIWEGSKEDIEWAQSVNAKRQSADAQAWYEAAVDLVDYFDAIVVANRRSDGMSSKPRKQGGGRPKTSRGEAREMAADLLGISTEALRKAEDRARTRLKVPTKEDEWRLDGYGYPIPDDVAHSAKLVHYHLNAVDGLLRKAQTEVTKLEGSALHPQLQQSVYNDVRDTAHTVRLAKPFALCPYCKATPGPREACGSCLGDGFCTKGVFDGAPKTLREDAVVIFGGQFVHMSTLRVVAGRSLGLNGFGALPAFEGDTFEEEHEPPREWSPGSDENDLDVIIED